MSLSLVLSLQAAAVATPAAPTLPPAALAPDAAHPAPVNPLNFDLARYRGDGSGNCGAAAGTEVLVCGPRRSGGAYPLGYWARVFGREAPIRAETGLGGGAVGRVYTDAVPMDRGLVSNRVLVGIKLPF